MTPLQALNLLRERYPHYQDSVLSYAGRLDPLAEGVMLVLVDGANQERERYLGLDKEYEFEILFGVSTDTGDLMGLVQEVADPGVIGKEAAEEALADFVGRRQQSSPRYSSPGIDGKDFVKEVEIYEAEALSVGTIAGARILDSGSARIGSVQGEFRQEEIVSRWREVLKGKEAVEYPLVRMRVFASSGTYIRVLAEEMGKKMGLPALAFSIKRTRAGQHGVADCLPLDR
ncbi:MAG TPA: hypothetical protein VEB60_01895 [Candidatus Paceibacterota bacterium]|nr:hypothetical protein [Candidatus Paceibacterota bacterium]